MGSLAEIILSFLNLLEAEGRALRAGIARVAIALALAALVAALFIAGLGLIVWSIYLFLRMAHAAPATAALLDGLITLLLGGLVTWIALKTAR